MDRQVASQERPLRKRSISEPGFLSVRGFLSAPFVMHSSQAARNSSAVLPIFTKPRSPYGRTTSRIGVETTRRPADKYSGGLVGLIKRVESFMAKGRSPTSQPAK